VKTRSCIPVRTAERRAFAKCTTLGLPCWWLRWLVPVAGLGSGHVHARGPGAREGLPATAPRPGIGRATAVPASPAAVPAAGPAERPIGPACPLPAAGGASSAPGAAAGRALRYGRGFESRHCSDLPADPRPAPGAPRYGAGPGARGRRDESPGSRPQP